jgi:hypothetical protein
MHRSNAFPDAAEHATVILLALEGDYQTALEWMDVYIAEYGEAYAQRLAACLRSQGEASRLIHCRNNPSRL